MLLYLFFKVNILNSQYATTPVEIHIIHMEVLRKVYFTHCVNFKLISPCSRVN